MGFELTDMTGMVFKNDRKKNEKHSDYNGSVKIDGKEYWLNMWIKEGAKGKFFSVAVKEKDQLAESTEVVQDNDLPF